MSSCRRTLRLPLRYLQYSCFLSSHGTHLFLFDSVVVFCFNLLTFLCDRPPASERGVLLQRNVGIAGCVLGQRRARPHDRRIVFGPWLHLSPYQG